MLVLLVPVAVAAALAAHYLLAHLELAPALLVLPHRPQHHRRPHLHRQPQLIVLGKGQVAAVAQADALGGAVQHAGILDGREAPRLGRYHRLDVSLTCTR